MRHTRHGWWLEEAGDIVPTRPLEGETSADVVVGGGRYLGLWAAWHVLELEPDSVSEPLRYAGGSVIRRALLAKDAAEDAVRTPGALTTLVASISRRLRLRLPR